MSLPSAPKIKSKVDDPALVERRRSQLTQAAIAAFSEKGFHPTTIRDIAERADVSIGLIYQYVEFKEDLLFLALVEVLESYRRQIPAALEGVEGPLPRFRAAVLAYCRVNDTSRDATVLAYRETKSLDRARRNIIKRMECDTNELIAACVRDCIAGGLFVEIDIELFTHQLILVSHGWALKAWRLQEKMSVEQYVDRSLDLMLKAIVTSRGERQLRQIDAAPAKAPVRRS